MVGRIASAGSLLLVTHARPDGDGLGAMAALASAGRAVGKTVRMLVPDIVPPRYGFLFGDEYPAGPAEFDKLADMSDIIVIADTSAFAQLDGLENSLRAGRDKIVVIDHHTTSDDVGAVKWVDPTAAAVGVMTVEIIDSLGWPVNAQAAEALMTAMASDTGWFSFSNTDPRTLRSAAKMLELGARTDLLYAKIYQSDRPERLRLLERVLASLELHCDGRLAVMTVRKSDFDEIGARPDETENLINESLRLKSVEAAVFLVEEAQCVRVSLRSRGGINVAAIASTFGGGGHARAAGLRMEKNIDEVSRQIIDACKEKLI